MKEKAENGNTAPEGGPAQKWEPRILAFLCNWCSYAGADLAGISRIQYPPNTRVIRVPCSGRVNPMFILRALQQGIDGVLVSGCHPGDCHYLTGNYYARRRFYLLKQLIEFCGIEPGRVQFSWVSASEGQKFADMISKVTADVKKLGPATRMVKKMWKAEDIWGTVDIQGIAEGVAQRKVE